MANLLFATRESDSLRSENPRMSQPSRGLVSVYPQPQPSGIPADPFSRSPYHEGATPEPNRVLAHSESLSDVAAGPAREGQQDRACPVGLAPIPRVAERPQGPPLVFRSRER